MRFSTRSGARDRWFIKALIEVLKVGCVSAAFSIVAYIITLLGGYPSQQTRSGIESQGQLTSVDLGTALVWNHRAQARFVDVRSRGDFERGHIFDSDHLSSIAIGERDSGAVDGRQVILVCDTGECPGPLLAVMRSARFIGQKVYVLRGGFALWRDAGLPTGSGFHK